MKRIFALLLACTLVLSVIFATASCDMIGTSLGSQDSVKDPADNSDNTVGGNVGDNNDNNIGNNPEDNTGDNTNDNVGDNNADNTGDKPGDNTGDNIDDSTGDNSGEEDNKDPNKFVSTSLEKVAETTDRLYNAIGSTIVTYPARNQYIIKNIVTGKTSEEVFVDVSLMDDYFVVKAKYPETVNDLDAINSTGVINTDVTKTVPCEYALIRKITTGYAVAYKATEITEDQSEALLYLTSNMFSIKPEEGDTHYKGEWCVIELATGRKLEGFGGTAIPSFYVNGDVIVAKEKDQEYVRISTSGHVIPDGANLLSNGCYIPGGENTVYTSNGEKLFDFASGSTISADNADYFIVGTTDKSTWKTTYTLVDRTGATISATFEKRPNVYAGTFVTVGDGNVYLFDGTKVAEGDLYFATHKDSYYLVEFYKPERVILMDSEFNVLLDITDDSLYIDRGNMLFGKEDSSYKVTYYSYAQNDFVYKGSNVTLWMVRVTTADGISQFINTRTDEILVSGYTVSCTYIDADGNFYFYVNEDGTNVCYKLAK